MQGIGDFLKRYINFTPPALARSRVVAQVVREHFGIECDESRVNLRGDIAFVQLNAALKSEIALHKQALLMRINELGGKLADLK